MGARYLENRHNVSRIAILDYDVHEGDGTHHVFDHHKDVLFISVHRYDRGSYYPGGAGGNFPNCGKGEAEGTKINIPLNTTSRKRRSYDFQAPGDNEYVYLYNRIIHPILKEFDPEFILVSSGFDASRKDYLGGFTVTPNSYYYMTRRLLELGKPMLCVLEGGYHLGSTAQAATAVVRGLLEE
jgi:histone deacetylase 6